MAFLAALFAIGSRFAGKVLTTALGWASTLLFGRVPAARQVLLLAITFGSVIWLVLLAGVLFPDLGTFLLVLVPDQQLIPEWVIRLLMLIAAVIVPGVVGLLTMRLEGASTPLGARRVIGAIVLGYPLTALLAVLLLFLAGLAVYRKGRSLVRGWTDAHVPLIVQPGRYDEVADDLDRALAAVGLEVEASEAPATMSKPARWLAAIVGPSTAALVPERMIQLDGEDLSILIYPMDILISGKPRHVVRARAAMASRLTTSAAHLTASAEAQGIEDRLAALARPQQDTPDRPRGLNAAAAAEFASIDEALVSLEIPYEEWEVLYRERLQVERDLRAEAMAGEAVLGAKTPGTEPDGLRGALQDVRDLVKSGAGAVIEVASDERTGVVLDRLAGPRWRWAARAASVAALVARAALTTRGGGQRDAADEAATPDTTGSPATDVASGQRPRSATP